MSIIIKELAYSHSNREILFESLSFSLNEGKKAALIGNNGSGKSTLLQILAGKLEPTRGKILLEDSVYYVPQHFGQYNEVNIAQALGIDKKVLALQEILKGDSSLEHYTVLDDDWIIEDRAFAALDEWDLHPEDLFYPMNLLSGGEKTRVFLAGISIHSPHIILMDEPTNHLDKRSRNQLYQFIENTSSTLLVVSHDRTLLNLFDVTLELTPGGIINYGGNYEFYRQEKEKTEHALQASLDEKEKQLKQAKNIAHKTIERQQKHSARGEKQNQKKGLARIALGNLKSQAEKHTSKLSDIHSGKIENLLQDLSTIRQKLSNSQKLKLNIENTSLHKGKTLVEAENINFGYENNQLLWKSPLSFTVQSGDRIVISGDNGSGKTTLVKMILGKLLPKEGTIKRADFISLYIDQEYSLLSNKFSIYEQTESFNTCILPESEVKIRLNRFLFSRDTWDKSVAGLSGGEKIRLLLCCLQIQNNIPDVFILDEPSNNLDIHSLEILTRTLQDYKGTILLISHDEYFVEEIGIDRGINLE
jgi:ATPase components of ABC transporters with duplicated ATPase domains